MHDRVWYLSVPKSYFEDAMSAGPFEKIDLVDEAATLLASNDTDAPAEMSRIASLRFRIRHALASEVVSEVSDGLFIFNLQARVESVALLSNASHEMWRCAARPNFNND